MIGAATWLLGKFGLSLAEGKSLMPIAAFIAACVAAVGLLVYIAHALTAAGYDKAMAECNDEKRIALEWKSYLEGELKTANKGVMVAHAGDQARLKAAEPAMKQEVENYVENNPAVAACGLDADGLRIWNAAPASGGTGLRLRPGAAEAKPGEPAGSNGGRSAGADAKPPAVESRVPRPVSQAPRSIGGGAELLVRAIAWASEGRTEVRAG